MNTTRTTLIHRVKDPDNSQAWEEFHRLYSGLIYSYARSRGLNDSDAAEIESECMAALSRQMKTFQHDPQRCKFRNWLRSIVANKIVDWYRKKKPDRASTALLSNMSDPQQSPDEIWEREWELNHLLHCLNILEQEISPIHAQAFRLFVIDQLPAREVATRLELSVENVYTIKMRMVERLKRAMFELLGEH